MRTYVICGAWPYANGPLHIGHIASLLPGDLLARYLRAQGRPVLYVSGSDCHGTPITIRAAQEGVSPGQISARYHRQFRRDFARLGFSYDHYGATTDPEHIAFVQDFHRQLYRSAHVQRRTVDAPYCPQCGRLLTDRMVVGRCPYCKGEARGDQCDACGAILEPGQVEQPRCAACGSPPEFRRTTALYLCLSQLAESLGELLRRRPAWRANARAFTRRYLEVGLRDRAITRDLDWGIDVPLPGYEDKKIYIWAENVLGYLSATAAACATRGLRFSDYWGEDSYHYYIHGKDNIPFHTIILPGLLLAHGGGYHLPDAVLSSEYITLQGRKVSTSAGWAVWAADLLARYDPDAIRYFFIANGPERRDADFSFEQFAARNNAELVGVYGNFIHRTLAFVNRYLGSAVPDGAPDPTLRRAVDEAFAGTGSDLEKGRLREALLRVIELARLGNRYFDAHAPWLARVHNPADCANTLFNYVLLVCALAVLSGPFLPFSAARVQSWLGLENRWRFQPAVPGAALPEAQALFARITPAQVQAELARLGS